MSFSFGTPLSAPATTGLTGFNFGANKPATSGFGLPATSQPSSGLFGSTATTSAPAFGSTGFGTSAFGATTTPAFGTTPSAPTFGTTSNVPTFGATTTPAFGANTTSTFNVNTTPFGTGLGTVGLNFGTGTSPAAPGGGITFPTSVTIASTGLGGLGGFGFGTNTATTQSTGFAPFGSTSTATTTTSLFVDTMLPYQSSPTPIPVTQTFQMLPHSNIDRTVPNIDLSPIRNERECSYEYRSTKRDCYRIITPSLGTTLGTTSATGTLLSTSVTPSLGLGGVAPTSGGIGATSVTIAGDGKSEPPKQTKLPNEISSTVDSFKEFVKKQKSLSSDLMRVSIKPLHKVSREAEATLRLTLSLSGEVSRARAHSRRLRAAATAALAAAEGAARDTAGSELEGTAPPAYIKDLISELEQHLITFRRQMDVADKQMQASPKLLTEQELTLGIRRMHESLVALAGRLQAVHTQVEAQKEQYLNLRKYVLKDPTDVFDTPTSSPSLDQILRDAEGTRKKTKTSALIDVTLGSAVLSDPRAVLGSLQQLAGPTPFTYLCSTLTPFPNADTSSVSWQPQTQTNLSTWHNVSGFATASPDTSASFQLQKPPGKRGKQ